LLSLSPWVPQRLDARQDVYLATPWSRATEATRSTVCTLAEMGWRLVGDSPNQPHFDESEARIASIIRTSQGAIIILPFEPSKPPSYTSPWILEEAHIALNCQKPFLLLAEDGVEAPNELVASSFGGTILRILVDNVAPSIKEVLEEFDEELARRPFSDTETYSFFATSLLGDTRETDEIISVIERASNMNCMLGQKLDSQHVQHAIIDRISRAAFVIADVTENNYNTLIEAGIAMGSRTPLHLICQVPESGSLKKRFMFGDMEMNWYQTPIERLAIAYRIANQYKRRVYFPR